MNPSLHIQDLTTKRSLVFKRFPSNQKIGSSFVHAMNVILDIILQAFDNQSPYQLV